ncbi:hypothetical protein CGZ93_10365 [Enemella dayhoffiae]|uniref:Uncharacterized protein n=1 Tax=Enemella dayhoffiae TaxID=2016507 RepID=A0A255H2N9_9ACTN|nr:hypothetical protein CGZ93_10365 [Enemella dayhoffiae]
MTARQYPDLEPWTGGDDALEHLTGLIESLSEQWDRPANPYDWAASRDEFRARIERRIEYHFSALVRMPTFGRDFCWEWTCARYLAHRNYLAILERSQALGDAV